MAAAGVPVALDGGLGEDDDRGVAHRIELPLWRLVTAWIAGVLAVASAALLGVDLIRGRGPLLEPAIVAAAMLFLLAVVLPWRTRAGVTHARPTPLERAGAALDPLALWRRIARTDERERDVAEERLRRLQRDAEDLSDRLRRRREGPGGSSARE